MGARMHALRLALFPLLVATSLAAQSPTSSPDSAPPHAAPRWAAFYDLVALASDGERYGFEHRVAGHWTIGLTGTYAYRSGIVGPSTACCQPVAGTTWRDNSWSIGLAVRFGPPALPVLLRNRLTVYAGATMAYRWSDLRYVSPLWNTPGGPAQSREYQRHTGWEPGIEVGSRLRAVGPLFIDVGGWFRLVRLDDPTEAVAPGRVQSHLAAAVGIGW